MTSKETEEEVRERAALFAIGALSPEEAAVVERHLAAGEARYQREVAAFRAVADDLAYAAPPRAPRPAARDRVLARLAADSPAVITQEGFRFVLGARLDWQPGVVPGVEVKLLREGASGGRRTRLIRMAPGTIYPKHRHPEVEEVYLLEGDLVVNGVLMRAGDYCSAEANSVHDGARSPSGCTFVVTAGANELLS